MEYYSLVLKYHVQLLLFKTCEEMLSLFKGVDKNNVQLDKNVLK